VIQNEGTDSGFQFTEDAAYQETPFDEPLRGRSAIFEYWSDVPRSQDRIRFGYEILAVTEDMGIAQWWASFVRIPSQIQGRHFCCLSGRGESVQTISGMVAQTGD